MALVSRPLVRYVLTAAARDRLLLTLLLMIACGAAMSAFLGSSGLTEQGSFAIVFGASGLRFLGVIGMVLFCCFYIRRSFETKEVEFLLSRPLSRMNFLFSHSIAFAILSIAVTLMIMVAVCFLGRPDIGGLFAWGFSIGVEMIIMVSTALFFSMVVSSAAGSALATLGFYVLARLIGTLIGIASVAPSNVVFAILNRLMDMISILVPRIDVMGQTSWLIYGVEGSGGIDFLARATSYAHVMMEHLGPLGFITLQGVFFCGLLLAASAFDFARRQF